MWAHNLPAPGRIPVSTSGIKIEGFQVVVDIQTYRERNLCSVHIDPH